MDMIKQYLHSIGIGYEFNFDNEIYKEKFDKLIEEAKPPFKHCYIVFGSKCKDKDVFIQSLLAYIVKELQKSVQIIRGFQPEVIGQFQDMYALVYKDLEFLLTDKDRAIWRNSILNRIKNQKITILDIESVSSLQGIFGKPFMDAIAIDSIAVLLPEDNKNRPLTI